MESTGWVFWMNSDDPRTSVAASNSLLDRGYGKPVAPIELDHHVGEFEGLEYHDLMRTIADEAKAMGLQVHIDGSDDESSRSCQNKRPKKVGSLA